MKKGEFFEGIIESVDFPNKGRVRVDEQIITVKNGIPGQTIKGLINKKKGSRLEARLMEVLAPSPLETNAAVCKNFPACGGCMYQTMAYDEQLKMKSRQVKALLDAAIKDGQQTDSDGNADYQFEGIIGSPLQFGYRNKMEFSFGDEFKETVPSL